jgi:alkylhydroperoxidase/carboxymuconolactone decarboxylase family protein YurZ
MSDTSNSKTPPPGKLPGRFLKFQKNFPEVFQAYDALGNATATAGPLDGKTRALVKLAIAIGGQMEGAVHSHTRRAVEAGCAPEEIRHVALLATTTIGFPSMMKTLSWVEDIIGNDPTEPRIDTNKHK